MSYANTGCSKHLYVLAYVPRAAGPFCCQFSPFCFYSVRYNLFVYLFFYFCIYTHSNTHIANILVFRKPLSFSLHFPNLPIAAASPPVCLSVSLHPRAYAHTPHLPHPFQHPQSYFTHSVGLAPKLFNYCRAPFH